MSNKPERPVLRYHGGKWMLADWIISNFPPHRIYVEPFGGAGSVLMQKDRTYAEIYNDLDGEIVNVFRILRGPNAGELERLISLTPFSRDEFIASYETSDDTVEQARRTIVRSFMGFGSTAATGFGTGFRSNSNRSGTTPARDWANLPPRVAEWAERLTGVVIENKDALEMMPQHDTPQTLFYVDPPYVLSTRKLANPYCGKGYRHEMDDEQHEALAESLHALQGMVVLSGYPCPLYDSLYSDWATEVRSAHADGARDRVEKLWINEAAAAQHQRLLAFDTGS